MNRQSLASGQDIVYSLLDDDEKALSAYLERGQHDVEARLNRYLPEGENVLQEAMRYSLFAGGKRFRPTLCLAAFEAVQTPEMTREAVLPFACALELIHTYSLVHDDLPAMDNDDFRRGRPTSHKQYGEGTAILVGDALLTAAFACMADSDGAAVSPQQRLAAISEIARAAGIEGMVLGQFMDLQAESQETMGLEDVEAIHRYKTGALITASVRVGGIIGGALPDQLSALTVYGQHIGLAFQIRDDLLDVVGDASELGKSVGQDKNKWTYPRLMGVRAAEEKACQCVASAVSALSAFGSPADPLRWIAGYTLRRRK